ncbi:MAG: helix-turn-helix domain-containing protein [gamma proteobacterium endosymbiont of Lamellibrachia anaximandri]|nr:helix-turn-helix domain-containing protein [gamma proteobacterium endosymbiont of Lamellibrachia anaximandri]MBL3617861.1 helix-turn-helix domain-containing protein [gamma proteobacterium endosymbiont of Lamellibrachia anaximandri]
MARKITPLPLPESPLIDTLAEFGAHVRSMRTQMQLRIDDAAALCGVSVQLLSDLENGRRSVGLDKALTVARQLGLSLVAIPRTELNAALSHIHKARK